MQVHHALLGKTAFFACNDWLKGPPGSPTNDKHLTASLPGSAQTHYRITVATGDVRSAGTDSDVFLTVHGSNGSTGERELASNANNFERGQKDQFTIQCANIGDIQGAHVRICPLMFVARLLRQFT